MYGISATIEQLDRESESGYNLFGGRSIADNPQSERNRRERIQRMINDLSSGRGWNDFSAADIFGSKVRPALFESEEYVPINYGDVQAQTIADNLTNIPQANALMDAINMALRDDSQMRVDRWAPGFGDSLKTMTSAARSLLGGQLPYSDVLDIVSNRQELGNTLGTAGTYTNATLKDLGLSRLSAMQTGSEMLSRISNLVESIDPIAQRSRPQDWMLAPRETVPLRQQDNQFAATYDQMERILTQQSEQNANVLNAAADPAARGLFGANFALETGTPIGGAGGSGAGSFDWAGLISGIYGAYRGSQQQGGGGMYGNTGSGQRFNPDSQWGTSYIPSEGGGADGSLFPAGMYENSLY